MSLALLAVLAGGTTMALVRWRETGPTLSAEGFVPEPVLAPDGAVLVAVRATDHDAGSDDDELRLYVDEVLVDAQTGNGPWTLRWEEPPPGDHEVHVSALSRGTLTTSDRVPFTVPGADGDGNEPIEEQEPRGDLARPDPPSTATTEPRHGSDSYGQWIVVIASLPTDEYTEGQLGGEIMARGLPWLSYLRSDDYLSLRPGYWVLYDGPYRSATEALGVCESWGLSTPSECYGRPLTDDLADRDVVAE